MLTVPLSPESNGVRWGAWEGPKLDPCPLLPRCSFVARRGSSARGREFRANRNFFPQCCQHGLSGEGGAGAWAGFTERTSPLLPKQNITSPRAYGVSKTRGKAGAARNAFAGSRAESSLLVYDSAGRQTLGPAPPTPPPPHPRVYDVGEPAGQPLLPCRLPSGSWGAGGQRAICLRTRGTGTRTCPRF